MTVLSSGWRVQLDSRQDGIGKALVWDLLNIKHLEGKSVEGSSQVILGKWFIETDFELISFSNSITTCFTQCILYKTFKLLV